MSKVRKLRSILILASLAVFSIILLELFDPNESSKESVFVFRSALYRYFDLQSGQPARRLLHVSNISGRNLYRNVILKYKNCVSENYSAFNNCNNIVIFENLFSYLEKQIKSPPVSEPRFA